VNVAAAIRAGAATRSAVVFVESGSGRRAIVESRDAALDIRLDEISPAELCSGRVMLVDGTDIRLSLRAAAAARRRGTRTIVDLDRIHPATMELLSQIDVVILPEGLVRELTRKTTIGEALTSLAAALPSAALLAVTLGEAGVLGVCGGKEIHVPAFAVNALDTTGAGDAFRAGFAARWLEAGEMGAEVSDLLEYAALVAALSCQALGAQTGLPTPADVAFARSKRV
jgi:sugar/nucleoside kinase (ribokinase family)